MTADQFFAQVDTAVATLNALHAHKAAGFAKATDIDLAACECAAEITGYDATFCKLLNREFREGAVNVALERAYGAVSA